MLLSFLLSKIFGVIGECASIFVAYVVRAVVLNVIYHKILNFDMVQFAKKCYVRMSLPIVATVAAGVGVNTFLILFWGMEVIYII